jgi:hypothetical protein
MLSLKNNDLDYNIVFLTDILAMTNDNKEKRLKEIYPS